jgi:hypothetical protein
MPTFKVTDESVNDYGFRVLTGGIDLKTFKKNPIMLWMHNRAFMGKEDEVLPIGKWENIRMEDGALLMDPVFDDNDPFAQKIKAKVDSGIINMASIGISILAVSDAKKDLIVGQTSSTVTKSKLDEVSLVDIGSNAQALKLYTQDGKEIKLSKTGDYSDVVPPINNQSQNQMKKLALKLGLAEDATEDQIEAAIAKLQADKTTAETSLASAATATVEALVDSAIENKQLLAGDKEGFVNAYKNNIEGLKLALKKIPVQKKPGDLINLASGDQPVDGELKTFEDLTKQGVDAVAKLKSEDRPLYNTLFKARYGFDPKD